MGVFLIILILIFAFGPYIWRRWIQPWIIKRAQRKMEDYLRAATGMPPRDSKAGKKQTRPQDDDSRRSSRRRRRYYNPEPGPILPRDYAVDVEYTEIKEYSESVEITGEQHGRRKTQRVTVEEQVSDVEYTEIKLRK